MKSVIPNCRCHCKADGARGARLRRRSYEARPLARRGEAGRHSPRLYPNKELVMCAVTISGIHDNFVQRRKSIVLSLPLPRLKGLYAPLGWERFQCGFNNLPLCVFQIDLIKSDRPSSVVHPAQSTPGPPGPPGTSGYRISYPSLPSRKAVPGRGAARLHSRAQPNQAPEPQWHFWTEPI